MRGRVKKAALPVMLAVLLCVLSACGIDSTVEDLFTLPRVPDEYTGLSQQIEALLSDGYEYAPPTAGQNLQAVQMVDLNGDGSQEAVVYLRKPNDERPMKIMVFEKLDESYERLCTVESSGSSIDSVYYEDMTGDGQNELVVGWKISSSVQTVAVYSIGREAIPLMSDSYTRFVVQELNTYDPPALFVLRSDSDGMPMAEVYTWQTNILAVTYRCGLSSTMTDLNRGSVVKGNILGGKPAVFITGVNEDNMAVTDILVWDTYWGLSNLALDVSTGKSVVIHPYHQLVPQDMNDDGVTEIPCPDAWGTGNDTLAYWVQYNRFGSNKVVAQTYHCQSGGWYFQVPDDWQSSVSAESQETVTGENQVILSVNTKPVLALYTITNENRENRAEMGNRFLLRRQPGVNYAAELLDGAAQCGLNVETVKANFHMTVSTWTHSDK